jgi:hypothetical protein
MKNAQCEHVVCDAHDQPAASAPRRGLGLGHEFPCRRLDGEHLFERGGVVEVGAENAAAPDL